MKKNVQFIIYILIIVILATVVWIKYDYDSSHDNKKDNTNSTAIKEEKFKEFIRNNNIKSSTFSCPAKNETIIYLDNNYLLTSLGDLYKVKFNSIFENGHNCIKIDTNVKFSNFYSNNGILYDDNDIFYDVKNNLKIIDNSVTAFYKEDLNNLKTINKKFPYIYFYDVSAKTLELDDTMFSNKLLIDNRGDINVFTNYGYPTSLSLINNETVETIFDRTNYIGVPLSIYRTRNNEQISSAKYLSIMEEVPDEVYGIRLITNRGMYNEVIDKDCKTSTCNTKLVMDKEFSTYFDNITFTNGKYIFIKDTPTTIYNIEKYVSTTE